MSLGFPAFGFTSLWSTLKWTLPEPCLAKHVPRYSTINYKLIVLKTQTHLHAEYYRSTQKCPAGVSVGGRRSSSDDRPASDETCGDAAAAEGCAVSVAAGRKGTDAHSRSICCVANSTGIDPKRSSETWIQTSFINSRSHKWKSKGEFDIARSFMARVKLLRRSLHYVNACLYFCDVTRSQTPGGSTVRQGARCNER